LKGTHTGTIPARFGLIWFSGFWEDLNGIFNQNMILLNFFFAYNYHTSYLYNIYYWISHKSYYFVYLNLSSKKRNKTFLNHYILLHFIRLKLNIACNISLGNYVSLSNEGRHIVLVWFFLPLLLLPQGNHVAKFGKDPIYRTKVIVRKPVWTPAIPNHIIWSVPRRAYKNDLKNRDLPRNFIFSLQNNGWNMECIWKIVVKKVWQIHAGEDFFLCKCSNIKVLKLNRIPKFYLNALQSFSLCGRPPYPIT
jgi:hypothetical protein